MSKKQRESVIAVPVRKDRYEELVPKLGFQLLSEMQEDCMDGGGPRQRLRKVENPEVVGLGESRRQVVYKTQVCFRRDR